MKKPYSPGFSSGRIAKLILRTVKHCVLNLSGYSVLTEAASGAYVVTPVLAAVAGAKRVYAITRSTKYGTFDEVSAQTLTVARMLNVENRIEIIQAKSREILAKADIITNSGHVRPIDSEMIDLMKSDAVISLMYEAWEWRPEDVDLHACARRGIRVGGVNEQHSFVDIYPCLGIMATKLLVDAGIPIHGNEILLLCDNSFRDSLERFLTSAGACVHVSTSIASSSVHWDCDVILIAMTPQPSAIIGRDEASIIADRWPSALVAQFMGDVDREALVQLGISVWPVDPPPPGHMGVLPSEIGPEPIVRLQAGGLKVGELLKRDLREDLESQSLVQMIDLEQYKHIEKNG